MQAYSSRRRGRRLAWLAYPLAALVLLQTFSRELVVVDFALNRASLTARFCVNKARPALRCNGKCYFAKKLKQQEERENRSAGPLKERLEMLPAAFGAWQPGPAAGPVAAASYGGVAVPAVPMLSRRGVFRPPQRLG